MSPTVQHIVDSFDALPEAEKHEAAVEILRRYDGSIERDLPETALIEAAEELFGALDAEEANNAAG